MNILMAFRYSPHTTAAYYAKAFRALGHDVRTWGPTVDLTPWREDQRYRLTGPHSYKPTADGWQPDLYVYIEAGGGWFPSEVPQHTIPTIGYFIDSHSRLKEHIQRATRFDHVFYAHKQFGDWFGSNAHWLPVACDPDVHTPTHVPEEPLYDVAFVGNIYGDDAIYAERRRLLKLLASKYTCAFVSNAYFEDMANVYANARVAFNKSAHGDLNMRVFEAMCSGTPLVTDDVPESGMFWRPHDHEELLSEAFDLYVYRSDEEVFNLVSMLIACDFERESVGECGRETVLAHHTYVHRAQQMLAEVGL